MVVVNDNIGQTVKLLRGILLGPGFAAPLGPKRGISSFGPFINPSPAGADSPEASMMLMMLAKEASVISIIGLACAQSPLMESTCFSALPQDSKMGLGASIGKGRKPPRCQRLQRQRLFPRMRARRVLVLRLGVWGFGVDAKSVRSVCKHPPCVRHMSAACPPCVRRVSASVLAENRRETQNCRRFWTRPASSRLKSVNSHRDRGGHGRERQNCPRFWTCIGSSRLKSVNSHRDRGGRGRETQNCRDFRTCLRVSKVSTVTGIGGSWSRNAELSSLLDLPLGEGGVEKRDERREKTEARREERGERGDRREEREEERREERRERREERKERRERREERKVRER